MHRCVGFLAGFTRRPPPAFRDAWRTDVSAACSTVTAVSITALAFFSAASGVHGSSRNDQWWFSVLSADKSALKHRSLLLQMRGYTSSSIVRAPSLLLIETEMKLKVGSHSLSFRSGCVAPATIRRLS